MNISGHSYTHAPLRANECSRRSVRVLSSVDVCTCLRIRMTVCAEFIEQGSIHRLEYVHLYVQADCNVPEIVRMCMCIMLCTYVQN